MFRIFRYVTFDLNLNDPNILLKKYIEHFQCLLIEMKVNNIDLKSPEYQELEAKYKEKERELNEINNRMDNFEKRLSDIDNQHYSRESILKRISE